MTKFAEELTARRRCDRSMKLSMKSVESHLPDPTPFPHQATSYTSGTILNDWQKMNRMEMEMRTTPRLASRRCLEVMSGSSAASEAAAAAALALAVFGESEPAPPVVVVPLE